MRRSIVLIGVVVLTMATASVAWAGNWAVTTVESMPDEFRPGETHVIDYSILQHGQTPTDAGDSYLTFRNNVTNEEMRFDAEYLGDGRYRAEVTLPSQGIWTWEVLQGWFGVQHMGTIETRSAAMDASDPRLLKVLLPLATLIAAGLTVSELMRIRRASPTVEVG